MESASPFDEMEGLLEEVEQSICPVCNSIVDDDATKCPTCGAEFEQED